MVQSDNREGTAMEWVGWVFFALIIVGAITVVVDKARERDAHRAMIEMNERQRRR